MSVYQDCPKAESKKYVSVCVFACGCDERPTREFLWRPTTLFPNNAWSWNRLFFHLPALCLASTPILLPQITCWSLMPGYLARVPFLSCPCMGVISSFVWPAVRGVGGITESLQIVVPGQWHSFISQMAIISLLWNYLIDCLNLLFSFHSKTKSEIHVSFSYEKSNRGYQTAQAVKQ